MDDWRRGGGLLRDAQLKLRTATCPVAGGNTAAMRAGDGLNHRQADAAAAIVAGAGRVLPPEQAKDIFNR